MIAADSNVLVYAEGFGDEHRIRVAKSLVRTATAKSLVLPAQVLAETYRVLVRKARLDPELARRRIAQYEEVATIAPTLETTLASGLDGATEHKLQIFDAIILAASAEAGCYVLMSEDLQHGFVWHGVTVVNPFVTPPHPLLIDLLRH